MSLAILKRDPSLDIFTSRVQVCALISSDTLEGILRAFGASFIYCLPRGGSGMAPALVDL